VPTLRIRDDMGRDLVIMRPPARVVSLVPSDTYSLFALGCGDRVVGRTRFCELPAEAAHVPTVGGTKDVDVDAVMALAPNLVVANQEENSRAALEKLATMTQVLVSLPRRAADGVAHLARLARILGVDKAPAVVELIRRGYQLVRDAQARASAPTAAPLPVFVPIWMDPLMTFNADTFGADILALCGARNVFDDRLRLYPLAADLGKSAPQDAGERDVRYPRIRLDEIAARGPAAMLLPDEPHAFTDADAQALAAAVPGLRHAHVSGKDLFWSGAWSLDAIPRLSAIVARLATAS
jgi:ABC-type Fe3+-hydroxamate transport system substrate-binding protein